jgi:hypothetical protein
VALSRCGGERNGSKTWPASEERALRQRSRGGPRAQILGHAGVRWSRNGLSGFCDSAGAELAGAHANGTAAGKRYLDEESGIKVLGTKPSKDLLAADGRAVPVERSKTASRVRLRRTVEVPLLLEMAAESFPSRAASSADVDALVYDEAFQPALAGVCRFPPRRDPGVEWALGAGQVSGRRFDNGCGV